MTTIVHSLAPVLLIGGGAASVADVMAARELVSTCVAVDGGLRLALASGVEPVAVVGDFDSVLPEDLARVPEAILHRITGQDDTDFEKALARLDVPLVLGIGFMGGRVDHQLAALHALIGPAAPPCILFAEEELLFHCPQALSLPCVAGDVVSLFPLAAVRGRSTGLEWPIDDLLLSPGGRIGTSNRALGDIRIESDGPGLIGIVPKRLLSALIPALVRAPLHGQRPAL